MNKLRKQSDTTYPLFFLMVDSTDHVTGKTGLSPTVTISKNGGSFASPSGAVSEVGNGVYKVAGNATDSNTVGELWIHATGSGADPTDTAYTVVAYDPFDAVRLGLTALPNAAAEAAGGLYTRGSGAGQINQPANGQIDVNTVKVGGTSQTARDIGASVLLSSGTGTGQVSITSGVVASNMTQIDGSATNGNNAVLKLKSLDIRSDSNTVAAIDVRGFNGGAGINGGNAIVITGGSAGASGTAGGHALSLTGGSATTNRGAGIKIVTPTGGTAIDIDATLNGSGIIVNSYGSALNLIGQHGCVQMSSTDAGYPALQIIAEGTSAPVVAIAPETPGFPYEGIGLSITGKTVDLQCDINGNLSGSVGSLNTQAKADVNAEVKDVMETDTQAEPTSVPAAESSFKEKIGWIFLRLRNKQTLTKASGVEKVYADNSVTQIGTSTDTDDGSTFTKGKMS